MLVRTFGSLQVSTDTIRTDCHAPLSDLMLRFDHTRQTERGRNFKMKAAQARIANSAAIALIALIPLASCAQQDRSSPPDSVVPLSAPRFPVPPEKVAAEMEALGQATLISLNSDSPDICNA